MKTPVLIAGSLILVTIGLRFTQPFDTKSRRALSGHEHGILAPKMIEKKREEMKYNLPERALEWCTEPALPPLNYNDCDASLPMNRIRLIGGLTNALKFLLLGAALSLEENRCFVVEENMSHLRLREDKDQQIDNFVQRYFEPIGLEHTDPVAREHRIENNIEERDHTELWEDDKQFLWHDKSFHLRGYEGIKGHDLKRILQRRVWRPLPETRHKACSGLEGHGLSEEFMAMGVRRGDKHLENAPEVPMELYIEAAERAIKTKFKKKVPNIFVATDDCAAIDELRALRPDWPFISECDRNGLEEKSREGFVLRDMKTWTLEETDEHFEKFMIELYAMTISRYFIGVSYTNVAWWTYFMKGWAARNEMEFVDVSSTQAMLDTW